MLHRFLLSARVKLSVRGLAVYAPTPEKEGIYRESVFARTFDAGRPFFEIRAVKLRWGTEAAICRLSLAGFSINSFGFGGTSAALVFGQRE